MDKSYDILLSQSSKRSKQMTHLNALQLSLSNERNRLAKAKTQGERDLRKVWVAQIEKEIAHEIEFLGNHADYIEQDPSIEMSDDELLAALTER